VCEVSAALRHGSSPSRTSSGAHNCWSNMVARFCGHAVDTTRSRCGARRYPPLCTLRGIRVFFGRFRTDSGIPSVCRQMPFTPMRGHRHAVGQESRRMKAPISGSFNRARIARETRLLGGMARAPQSEECRDLHRVRVSAAQSDLGLSWRGRPK
jgi:hypothetical protein